MRVFATRHARNVDAVGQRNGDVFAIDDDAFNVVVTEDDRAATRISARVSACISAGRSRFAKGNATLGDLCDRVVVIVFFAIGRIGFPRVFIPTIDVILVFVGIVLFDFDFDRMVAFAVARHLIVGFGWRCNHTIGGVEPVVKLSDEVDIEI